MLALICQDLLCRIHHAFQFAVDQMDYWLIAGCCDINLKKFQQLADVVALTVGMKAFESALWKTVIWFKIGGPTILLVCMLVTPRTGDIVHSRPQR